MTGTRTGEDAEWHAAWQRELLTRLALTSAGLPAEELLRAALASADDVPRVETPETRERGSVGLLEAITQMSRVTGLHTYDLTWLHTGRGRAVLREAELRGGMLTLPSGRRLTVAFTQDLMLEIHQLRRVVGDSPTDEGGWKPTNREDGWKTTNINDGEKETNNDVGWEATNQSDCWKIPNVSRVTSARTSHANGAMRALMSVLAFLRYAVRYRFAVLSVTVSAPVFVLASTRHGALVFVVSLLTFFLISCHMQNKEEHSDSASH